METRKWTLLVLPYKESSTQSSKKLYVYLSSFCDHKKEQDGLLRRTFSNHNSINSKKQLYISLVHSQLLYCSVWWNHISLSIFNCLNKSNDAQPNMYSMTSPVTINLVLLNYNCYLWCMFDLSDIMLLSGLQDQLPADSFCIISICMM